MNASIFNPGDKFGAYQAVRQLCKGGMGEVWLIRQENVRGTLDIRRENVIQ